MKPNLPEPYKTVVTSNDSRYLRNRLKDRALREYFDGCFRDTLDYFSIYPCWACVNCLKRGNGTTGWGEKPSTCPTCGSAAVYQIATFNAWASKVGEVFGWAFLNLMWEHFQIPLFPTPGNTATHDFEVTADVAIEAKGSPASITNPDRTIYHPGRPGMERTDTEKKAFSNARTFRQRKPDAYFCIVTNALPHKLVGYRDRDVNALFDITKVNRIQAFLREISEKVDLETIRRREFVSAT